MRERVRQQAKCNVHNNQNKKAGRRRRATVLPLPGEHNHAGQRQENDNKANKLPSLVVLPIHDLPHVRHLVRRHCSSRGAAGLPLTETPASRCTRHATGCVSLAWPKRLQPACNQPAASPPAAVFPGGTLRPAPLSTLPCRPAHPGRCRRTTCAGRCGPQPARCCTQVGRMRGQINQRIQSCQVWLASCSACPATQCLPICLRICQRPGMPLRPPTPPEDGNGDGSLRGGQVGRVARKHVVAHQALGQGGEREACWLHTCI